MRCRDVAERWSAYIDGELDEVSASALRGHLRTCEACCALVDDGARLRDALSDLEPADPPPLLWQAIERRIGDEEIADASRPRLALWWRRAVAQLRQHALPAAVLTTAVAAGVLALGRSGGGSAPSPSTVAGAAAQPGAPGAGLAAADSPDRRPGSPGASGSSDGVGQSGNPGGSGRPGTPGAAGSSGTPDVRPDYFAARAADVERADQRYQTAIAELLAAVEEERADWPAAVQRAFTERLESFRAAVERAAHAALAADPSERDALYAVYRQEIEFLQKAALGELTVAGLPRGGL